MTPIEQAAIRHLLGQYPKDPVRYIEEALGLLVTEQQASVARALVEPPYQVLVPSGHELGKTHLLGSLINWHHDNHNPGIVLATAPTALSLSKQLFKEVRKSRPFELGMLPAANVIRDKEDHFVLGLTTNNPDAFQGKHERAGLLIFDEATGVDALIWERGATMFKKRLGWYWIAAYNPYDPTTPPYALEQGGDWAVCRLSALDHPNVRAGQRGEPPPIPGAVDYEKLLARIHKECECHGHTRPEGGFEFPQGSDQWWSVRPGTLFDPQVRGRWPESGFDAIWSQADWDRCLKQTPPFDPRWPIQIGCDVSRFGGDRTAFAVRRGPVLIHLELIERWRTRRPSVEIGDRLRELCHQFAPVGVPPKQVPCLIDDTGGYGSGVTDHPDGYTFHGINAAEAAIRPDRFANRRAELWWTTRLAADDALFLLDTVRIPEKALHTLSLEMKQARSIKDKRHRRVVEGKDGMKARLGRSPDYADAVNLAWYPVPR